MNKVDVLLQEAETLLYKDIDKELAELADSSYPKMVNPEKYEKLLKLYEQVLEIEPGNEKAQTGILVCHDMLEPYMPVQHLAGPLPGDILMDDFINFQNKVQSNAGDKVTVFPWQVRRKLLDDFKKSDTAGIQYTQQVFLESGKKADQTVQKIISQAKTEVFRDKKDPYMICRQTIIRLKEFQEQLNRSWKGHGPGILHRAADTLIHELGIKGEIQKKIETILAYLSCQEKELHKTITLDKVDDHLINTTIGAQHSVEHFISIFSYINNTLPGFKQWVHEMLAFYSSLVFEIRVSSSGSYHIDAGFPSHPDKEADEVFLALGEYNMQKSICPEDSVDRIFLTWVWDRYFTVW